MNEKDYASEIRTVSGVAPEKCMKCGKCAASCPSFSQMEYHPHQFVDMVLGGRIEMLLESRSVEMCMSCFLCAERCPRGVFPADIIEAARSLRLRGKSGGADMDAAVLSRFDDAPEQLYTSAMRKYGR